MASQRLGRRLHEDPIRDRKQVGLQRAEPLPCIAAGRERANRHPRVSKEEAQGLASGIATGTGNGDGYGRRHMNEYT